MATKYAEVKTAKTDADAQKTIAETKLAEIKDEKVMANASKQKEAAVKAAAVAWQKFAAAFEYTYVDVMTPEARYITEEAREAAEDAEKFARRAIDLFNARFP